MAGLPGKSWRLASLAEEDDALRSWPRRAGLIRRPCSTSRELKALVVGPYAADGASWRRSTGWTSLTVRRRLGGGTVLTRVAQLLDGPRRRRG